MRCVKYPNFIAQTDLQMILLNKYFEQLTELQRQQFEALTPFYSSWNARINVISRKDIDNFEERHVLHSLAIASVIRFAAGTRILDVGTGGGFPGIPLAIMFPECEFTLVDSIGKKIRVVNEVKEELGLKNVTAQQARAEEIKSRFDFIVSRAVTTLPEFVSWVGNKIDRDNRNALSNGILYLKGGEIDNELKGLRTWRFTTTELKTIFTEEFFETKKLIHLYK